MSVYGNRGEWMNVDQLQASLKEIVSQSEKRGRGPPIGMLTSENRDNWFEAYELLLAADNENAKSIETIEKSLFVLCLDGDSSSFEATDDPVARTALQALHGLGPKYSAHNRWFDKTIQVYSVFMNDGTTNEG